MPSLKIKTVYIEKLKALGVYDRWLSNMKMWVDAPLHMSANYISKMYNAPTFNELIGNSFSWSKTPERHEFWRRIANR